MIVALTFVNIIFIAIAKYINTKNAKFFLQDIIQCQEKKEITLT